MADDGDSNRTDDEGASPSRIAKPRPRRRGRMMALGATMLLVALAGGAWAWMIRMPGRSYAGPLPPLTDGEAAYRDELRRHVEHLGETIGERHAGRPEALTMAGEYVAAELAKLGLSVERQRYEAGGQEFVNYEAEIQARGLDAPVVVIGAHYDGAIGTPAANDNATGVAALLVMAKIATSMGGWQSPPQASVRFVAFANEEPPHFQTPTMGSLVYAKRCRAAGDRITAMLSLETVGYYRDEPGTQSYPFPMSLLYPSTGNFIAFVGDNSSRGLTRELVRTFRQKTRFPSEGAVLPAAIPGVGWSDHWSFWQHGYPAVMVTDTAPFRYPHYHEPSDTPDKVSYDRLARVVVGLFRVVDEMVDYPVR